MTSFAEVEHFIDRSRRASSPRELDNLLADITGEMGFDHYALIHHVDLTPMSNDLAHMEDGTLVALTNYPPAWVEAYIARRIVDNDPVLLASHRSPAAFRWDDVPHYIEVTAEHREITADTRKAGLGEGYTVPARVPGEVNGSCNFAMRCGRALPEDKLTMAQVVGAFAFQAARTMVANARRQKRKAAPRRLTGRQLDCIRLVARGKTDWEIARILGLQEETVTEHINNARARCGVGRRAQLIVHALYRGDLTFADIIDGPGS